jgi:tetratricopeptide (TPR) repeat protein
MTLQPTEHQKTLNNIQKQHKALLLQVGELEDADVEQVYAFLNALSQAGAIIDDAEDRSLLSELIRYWSVFMNSKTGEFPVIQLQPFSLSLRASEQSVPLNHPALPENHAIFPDFLPTIWNVPYPHNPLFIGREQLLTALEAALQSGQTTTISQPQAITGLGGIGKTQLAMEYAYRHRKVYQAVLWALADTRENLTSSYLTIARLLNLAEQERQESDRVIMAVKQWLQRKSGWLLILDNADDLSLAREFLPPSFGGHVLLTTRTQTLGRFAHRLEVDVLSTEVGALFLLRRAGVLSSKASLNQAKQADQEVARAICEELGGLPLALDQAGAYIEETGCGLPEYHQLYQQHRAALLAERRGELVDDHPFPVATTWYLSFQQVEQQNPAAADLLSLCAFLAPDAIPEEMITGGTEVLGPVLGSISSDQLRMNEIVEELLRFSLIRRNSETRTLTIHRLVQAVIQDDMDKETQSTWAERAIRTVHHAFPDKVNDVKTWPQCQRCLPHALACARLIKDYRFVSLEAAQLLNQVGYYLREHARYREAWEYFQQALAISEQLGPEYLLYTAQILNNRARLYFDQYKYTEAEPLYEQALAIREQKLGPEHPVIAQNLNSLALNYWYEGKYEKAERLYQRALRISEQKLGPEHAQTLLILNNIALLYRSQGKYEEAIKQNQHILEVRKRKFGPVHPEVAQSLQNLAVTYYEQGNQSKHEEAEDLLKRALAIREELLPKKHLQSARCLRYLALVYEVQDKDEKAQECFKRAVEICEELLGVDHSQTIETKEEYTALLRKMKRD